MSSGHPDSGDPVGYVFRSPSLRDGFSRSETNGSSRRTLDVCRAFYVELYDPTSPAMITSFLRWLLVPVIVVFTKYDILCSTREKDFLHSTLSDDEVDAKVKAICASDYERMCVESLRRETGGSMPPFAKVSSEWMFDLRQEKHRSH